MTCAVCKEKSASQPSFLVQLDSFAPGSCFEIANEPFSPLI